MVILTLFESVVDVEQREVVPVDVCEAHLGIVGGFLGLVWTDETLRD